MSAVDTGRGRYDAIGKAPLRTLDPNRRHVVTTAVEHSATRRHCETVANRGGAVTIVDVDGNGNLDLNELECAITPQTAIITAMWANNETGVLFPVEKIAEIARRKRVLGRNIAHRLPC